MFPNHVIHIRMHIFWRFGAVFRQCSLFGLRTHAYFAKCSLDLISGLKLFLLLQILPGMGFGEYECPGADALCRQLGAEAVIIVIGTNVNLVRVSWHCRYLCFVIDALDAFATLVYLCMVVSKKRVPGYGSGSIVTYSEIRPSVSKHGH